MPPLPLGPDGEALARAFDALGWHWWPSDSYINSTRYDGRDACNNCGPNTYGCVVRAKASTDVTYLPKARDMGVEIRTNSRVTEITTGSDGRFPGLTTSILTAIASINRLDRSSWLQTASGRRGCSCCRSRTATQTVWPIRLD